jgi:hypothetical protein
MDLFKWSVPFLMEKIGDMMENLMMRSRAVEVATTGQPVLDSSPSLGDEDVQAILQ